MIMDKLTEFGDAFSVARAAATYSVDFAVDTSAVVRDLANGEPTYLVVTVDGTGAANDIKGATSGTITYRLVSADADRTAPTAFTTPTVHATSTAFATATAGTVADKTKAGSIAWVVALPQGAAYKRYLGVEVIVGGQTLTAGKINAFLTHDPTGWAAYSDQF